MIIKVIIKLINRIYGIVPAGVPGALVITAVLYLTLAPNPLGDDSPTLFDGADKVVHAIMFGAMSFTLALDRFMGGGKMSHASQGVIMLVTIATGIGIEWLQDSMACGRDGDVADCVADIAGAIAGMWLFTRLRKKMSQ